MRNYGVLCVNCFFVNSLHNENATLALCLMWCWHCRSNKSYSWAHLSSDWQDSLLPWPFCIIL